MMRKQLILLLSCFFIVATNHNASQSNNYYITASNKSGQKNAIPLVVTANASGGSDLFKFTSQGPLGNSFFKAYSAAGGFLRVDVEDKKLYTVSRINFQTDVDTNQASRFQVIFLNDYEEKLFKLRPIDQDKADWLETNKNTAAQEKMANILQTYSDMTKENLNEEDLTLLINEFSNFIKFITQGSNENHQNFYNQFAKNTTLVSKIDNLILALKALLKTPEATVALQNAIQSWDFGYTTIVVGAPVNNDVVVIKSEKNQLYLSVTKEKDLEGKDIFYLGFSAEDSVSASQFKVQEVGGRLGFTCISELGKNLVITATKTALESNLALVKRKTTRLLLMPQNKEKAFGVPGSEAEQFQISEQTATTSLEPGKFWLQSLGLEDVSTGFWMLDENDENMLRVMDYDKKAHAKTAVPNQYFSFTNITAAKELYEALSKARKESDLKLRFTSYINLLTAISNSANAIVLLKEIKNFMQENKKTAELWQAFLRNLTDPFNAFMEKFKEMFNNELSVADSLLQRTFVEVSNFFEEAFVEELINGLYAIAWVGRQNEKKYLNLVPEDQDLIPENYETFFKVMANGNDIFDPAAQFKIEVDKTTKTIQFESEYQKELVLGKDLNDNVNGPNDHLNAGESNYSKVKLCLNVQLASNGNLQDLAGETSPVEYLRVLGWREKRQASSNPEPNNIFKFKYQGSFANMNFKNLFADGYLNVDSKTGLIHAIDTKGKTEVPFATPGGNGRFELLPISKNQQKLAAARNSKSINDQVDAYLRLIEMVDNQTDKNFREQAVNEIGKFVKRIVSDPIAYAEAKTVDEKINLLISMINDAKKVATNKATVDKAAEIKKTWEAGFAGAFEDGSSYALTYKESEEVQKVLRAIKDPKLDQFLLQFVPVKGPEDLLHPLSKLLANVDTENNVTFTLESPNPTDPTQTTNYYLTNNDNITIKDNSKKRNGLLFKPGNKDIAQKFKIVQEVDTFIALKDIRDGYGFISCDAADRYPKTKDKNLIGVRHASTLSELSGNAAGLKDSKGVLQPSDLAKLNKFSYTPVHTKLALSRAIDDQSTRLTVYLEVASYTDLNDIQKESLANEFSFWIEQILQRKPIYDELSKNVSFSSKLIILLDQIKKILPSTSTASTRLDSAKESWQAGFIGEKNNLMPAAGSKLLLQVTQLDLTPTTTEPTKPIFLRVVNDEVLGKLVLKADADNAINNECLLEVMLRGERIGFKSPANENKIVFHTPLPTDQDELLSLQELAPSKKLENMALSLVDEATANFASNTPTGAQFVLSNPVSDGGKAVLATIREMTSQGILRLDQDNVARVIDYGTLDPNSRELRIRILPAGTMFDTALKIIANTDVTKQFEDFKTLVRQTKPKTHEKIFFEHTFNKAFTDKKDLTITRGAENLLLLAQKEWSIDKNDDAIKRMLKVANSSLPTGLDFATKIGTLLKDVLKKSKNRETDLKNFIKDYLLYWERALFTNWSDDNIIAELKINTDKVDKVDKTTERILSQRIKALSEFVTNLDLLIKQEQKAKIGFKEVYDQIRSKQKELIDQRKDIKSVASNADGSSLIDKLKTVAQQSRT